MERRAPAALVVARELEVKALVRRAHSHSPDTGEADPLWPGSQAVAVKIRVPGAYGCFAAISTNRMRQGCVPRLIHA
jgi:hypothetical protein